MHIVFNNTNISNTLFYKKIYKKDDIIFLDNDRCDKIGFVESGNISIVTSTFNENEYEINNISSNGFFGAYLIFSNNPYFLGTGIATQNTAVWYFNKNNLLLALSNKIFLENYLQLISESILKIQNKVKVLSQKTIRDKIMFVLYENYKRNKTKTFRFKSKIQLASYLNIPRPSLSRELLLLQSDKYIIFDRHTITII